ncbi:hypothetical protein [Legionella tunisiensis]|uniref:hypothetical protein n=1 Tax=Legionella tunisiensis TaxID=1034944 RepID=UPI0012EA27C6|nr:hypothetical protein [Legionella tunisiensis]
MTLNETELKSIINNRKIGNTIESLDELQQVIDAHPSYKEEILELIASDPKLIRQLVKTEDNLKRLLEIFGSKASSEESLLKPLEMKMLMTAEMINMPLVDSLNMILDMILMDMISKGEMTLEGINVENVKEEIEKMPSPIDTLRLFHQCLPENREIRGDQRVNALNDLEELIQKKKVIFKDFPKILDNLNNLIESIAKIRVPSLKELGIKFFQEKGLPSDELDKLPEELKEEVDPNYKKP